MSFIQALLLGILQAITEFFPVSSSAHLKIFKHLCGLQELDHCVLFDLSCHLGTLMALIWFLRLEIRDLFVKNRSNLWLFFLALLPLIPAYFLLKPLREWVAQRESVGICLCATGMILLLGQRWRIRSFSKSRPMQDALYIGMMQSAALIPGISRSASTISCARVLGWKIQDAVRFSFLLSIPTILGGNALELLKMARSEASFEIAWGSCLTAFLTSAIVGACIVRWAIQWLEKGNMKPFAAYCIALGGLSILYFNILGL